MRYQLSEAQREEIIKAAQFWAEDMAKVVQRIADAAHADGCRETIERAAQHVPVFDDETWNLRCSCGYMVRCNEFEWKGIWQQHIRALAPSQVKEAPNDKPNPLPWTSIHSEPKHAYFLSHINGPTYGHWVCECGTDLSDCSLDEIDSVFMQHVVSVLGAAQPSDAAEREATVLRAALSRIQDGDDKCGCDCDGEECCEKVSEFCPHCIATVALRQATARSTERKVRTHYWK